MILLAGLAVIGIAFIFADPPFYDWYYSRLWNQDRSSIFYHTTNLGKSNWMLLSSGGLMLIMSLYSLSDASRATVLRWRHQVMKLYFVFTSVAFAGLLTLGLKFLIGRARPVGTLPEDNQWHVLTFDEVAGHAGFPSGHSTAIGAFCMAMALLFPRFRAWLLLLALWVGATRVVVGAHFPSDVVAGLLVGSLFTWVHARNFARRRLLFKFTNDGNLCMRGYPSEQEATKSDDQPQANGLGVNVKVGTRPES